MEHCSEEHVYRTAEAYYLKVYMRWKASKSSFVFIEIKFRIPKNMLKFQTQSYESYFLFQKFFPVCNITPSQIGSIIFQTIKNSLKKN